MKITCSIKYFKSKQNHVLWLSYLLNPNLSFKPCLVVVIWNPDLAVNDVHWTFSGTTRFLCTQDFPLLYKISIIPKKSQLYLSDFSLLTDCYPGCLLFPLDPVWHQGCHRLGVTRGYPRPVLSLFSLVIAGQMSI